MGGLNKNSPSQGVSKVKIIKSENTKTLICIICFIKIEIVGDGITDTLILSALALAEHM